MGEMSHQTELETQLYQHVRRDQWGLAVLAWEQPDKRGYQFEDGKLRVFQKGFYHLMQPVEREKEHRLVQSLNRKLKVSERRQEVVAQARKNNQRLYTFEDQITAFCVEYPQGFGGEGWLTTQRGVGAKRRLKRHRDAAIAHAQDLLDPAQLEALLQQDEADTVHSRAVEVLRGTDLVSASQVELLQSLNDEQRAVFARALFELLFGRESFDARFDALVESIGEACSWPLATVFLALVYPNQHVCVQQTAFRGQAKWMAPEMNHRKIPKGTTYRQYLAMAQSVRDALHRHQLEPQDLLDVAEFIRFTMKPAAKRLAATAVH